MKKYFIVLMCVLMFTGCASLNTTQMATSIAGGGISLILQNNPSYKPAVCTAFINLDNLLKADCCWADYLIAINNSFAGKYAPIGAIVIASLDDTKPFFSSVNMSDAKKVEIKKIVDTLTLSIGCQ